MEREGLFGRKIFALLDTETMTPLGEKVAKTVEARCYRVLLAHMAHSFGTHFSAPRKDSFFSSLSRRIVFSVAHILFSAHFHPQVIFPLEYRCGTLSHYLTMATPAADGSTPTAKRIRVVKDLPECLLYLSEDNFRTQVKGRLEADQKDQSGEVMVAFEMKLAGEEGDATFDLQKLNLDQCGSYVAR
jgi:hypothetical protein